MRNGLMLIAMLSLISPSGLLANTVTIGLPSNGFNVIPFGGTVPANGVGTQYQQAYSSTNFSGLGPILITGINFFGDVSIGGNISSGTYIFSFSTITTGIDTLNDTNLNSNLGANNSLFRSIVLLGSVPRTLEITGTTPFLYDPSQGNLLLNIDISPGATSVTGGAFEANNMGSGEGLFSRYQNFGPGTIGDGLVTEFTFTAVPEPSSLITLAIAVLGVGLLRRKTTH